MSKEQCSLTEVGVSPSENLEGGKEARQEKRSALAKVEGPPLGRSVFPNRFDSLHATTQKLEQYLLRAFHITTHGLQVALKSGSGAAYA